MSNSSLVSVIMIFLNEETFIEEAIESIFAQTYDHWELLLVDDGSTDNSTSIAQRQAQQYPDKVHYLEHRDHQNRGMSASRNLAICHAKGEYIAFLDADDVWLPHKLEQQVALIESHPTAALVCGRSQWWYSWTGHPEDSQRDFIQTLNISLNTIVQPPRLLILFLLDEWASLCDILVRREVVNAVGGYESSFRGMYEDQVFHAKVCLSFPAFVSSECWYRYRQHPEACTLISHGSGKTNAARLMFLNWLEGYLSQQNLKNTEVWQIVQNDLWPYRHPHLARVLGHLQHPIQSVKRLSNRLMPTLLSTHVR